MPEPPEIIQQAAMIAAKIEPGQAMILTPIHFPLDPANPSQPPFCYAVIVVHRITEAEHAQLMSAAQIQQPISTAPSAPPPVLPEAGRAIPRQPRGPK